MLSPSTPSHPLATTKALCACDLGTFHWQHMLSPSSTYASVHTVIFEVRFLVKLLLPLTGLSVEAKSAALLSAVSSHDTSKAIVVELLNAGADVHYWDDAPLTQAACNGTADIVEVPASRASAPRSRAARERPCPGCALLDLVASTAPLLHLSASR